MSENKTNPQENPESTGSSPAEIKAMQQKRIDFYKESTKLLEVQYRYEDLLAKIEEARFRRIDAMQKTAYFYDQMEKIADAAERADNPTPEPTDENIPTKDEVPGEKRVRKLKTE